VWRLLVRDAREHGEAWTVAVVFVALPGLRRQATLLAKVSGGDVEAVLVEAFPRDPGGW
jgi:hypothetical protein